MKQKLPPFHPQTHYGSFWIHYGFHPQIHYGCVHILPHLHIHGRSISVPLQCLSWIISFSWLLKDIFLIIVPFPSFIIKFSFSAESFQVTYKRKTSSKPLPFLVTAPFLTSPFSPASPIGTSLPSCHWCGSLLRLPSIYPLTNPIIRSVLLFTLSLLSASFDTVNFCLVTLSILCFHGAIHTYPLGFSHISLQHLLSSSLTLPFLLTSTWWWGPMLQSLPLFPSLPSPLPSVGNLI